MIIQSVLFDKKIYTLSQALKKLMKRGFKYYKVDDHGDYFRFRQSEPIKNKNYKTIKTGKGIKYIIMY